MKLFVLRHGHAETFAASDAERNLTDAGCAEVRRVIADSINDLAALEKIWVSPLRRAQQTAAVVRDLLGDVPCENSDLLLPESSPAHVVELLSQELKPTVMLVSHQPLVGELVNGLCGKSRGYFAMDTGALAHIELEYLALGCGQLLWLR